MATVPNTSGRETCFCAVIICPRASERPLGSPHPPLSLHRSEGGEDVLPNQGVKHFSGNRFPPCADRRCSDDEDSLPYGRKGCLRGGAPADAGRKAQRHNRILLSGLIP